jgi:hypothetical protein
MVNFNKHIRYNNIESLSDPYYTLFFAIIGKTILYLDKQAVGHPISFVFDHQGNVGYRAAELVRLFPFLVRLIPYMRVE